jgi:beta-phosphoglucomutase
VLARAGAFSLLYNTDGDRNCPRRAWSSLMAEPAFQGVVLDLDGVVADSEPLHIRAWVEVLAELGVSQDDVGESTIRGWTGVPDVDIVDGLVAEQRLPLAPEQLLNRKRRAFRQLIPRALASFPGVAEELRRWDGTPLGLATATARREAELMLDTLGLRQVFRVVVTGDDVVRPKPDPDCYRLAARRLGLAPGDCAAVEDAPHGIRAARAAGLHALAVSTSFPPEALAEAERLFPTVLEALAWVAKRTRREGR